MTSYINNVYPCSRQNIYIDTYLLDMHCALKIIVGYGDLSPKRLGTRIAAVFYLPLCVATMAKVFNIITGRFLD